MKYVFAFWLVTMTTLSYAQVGGKRSFEFLNIPVSSRTTALGGINVSLVEEDGLQLINNPALSDSLTGGEISVSWLNYFAGINQSTVNYVHNHRGKFKINFGAIYLDYGKFQGFDATGKATAKFNAQEYAIVAGTSHQLNAFTFGANVKFAHSLLESYSSSALLLDIGGVFRPGPNGLSLAMVFKNIGITLTDYAVSDTKLPFDVQLGATFKPQYMPLRFSFTAYNLVRKNIVYFEQALDPNENEPGFAEKVFRHLNLGAELLLSKHFQVQAGYNYLLRKELRLQQTAAGAGFSLGLLIRVKQFELTYARSKYHAAGGANHLTLASNINSFIGKDNL